MTESFEFFQEASFNKIGFPLTDLTTSMSQRFQEHKVLNRDGTTFDYLGEEAITFTFNIPCYDSIEPALYETWTKGTLFSKVRPSIYNIYRNKKSCVFEHPYLGEFNVVIRSISESITSENRSGCVMSVTVAEHTELNDNPKSLDNASLPGLQSYYEALDSILNNTPEASLPATQKHRDSLKESVRKIQAIADKIDYMQSNGKQKFEAVRSDLKNLEASVRRIGKPILSPALVTISKMNNSSRVVEKKIAAPNKELLVAVAETNMSFVDIARKHKQSVSDIIRANTNKIQFAFVNAGETYYFYGDL